MYNFFYHPLTVAIVAVLLSVIASWCYNKYYYKRKLRIIAYYNINPYGGVDSYFEYTITVINDGKRPEYIRDIYLEKVGNGKNEVGVIIHPIKSASNTKIKINSNNSYDIKAKTPLIITNKKPVPFKYCGVQTSDRKIFVALIDKTAPKLYPKKSQEVIHFFRKRCSLFWRSYLIHYNTIHPTKIYLFFLNLSHLFRRRLP